MATHKQKAVLLQRLKTYFASPPFRRSFKTTAINPKNEIVADVVVAGGGMVGTSVCCALGSSEKFQNMKIILLEVGNKPELKEWDKAPIENRVSSITPGSSSFLNDIGVWDKIESRRYHPYEDLHVWDAGGSGCIDLRSSDAKQANMAFMVENSVIVESCTERVEELSDVVEVQYNAKIDHVNLPYLNDGSCSDLVEVHLENGAIINSKLLVGADGPNSFIREKAGIRTNDYDYGQSAVVATLNTKNSYGNNTAWQCFLPSGPIAILPISNDVSSLVWSTTRQHAKELMNDSEEEFVEKVNEALTGQSSHDSILGMTNKLISAIVSTVEPGRLTSNFVHHPPIITNVYPNSRGMFPLLLKHSAIYVKTRMALVGDAAHRIHPMAGLGVNLGFGDVKRLVEAIETAIYEGDDFGSLDVLLPYETDRQRHVLAVVTAINSLHKLFSTTIPPVVLARTLGLHATNSLNPLKNQIMKYAMQ